MGRLVGGTLLVIASALVAHSIAGAVGLPDVKFIARWGGITKDIGYAVVVPPSGRAVFVVGSAFSHDYPVTAGRQVPEQRWCAFATRLSSETGAAGYSSVLCSTGFTWGRVAAPAPDGQLWVGGSVDGSGLPVSPRAFQPSYGGSTSATGPGDGFVARWDAAGRAGVFASYIGGTGDDAVTAMLPDGAGGVWIVGTTTSPDFPVTAGAPSPRRRGIGDGFVAHVGADGRLLASSLVGGAGWDAPQALARVDEHRLLIAGRTTSRQFDDGGRPLVGADGFAMVIDTRTLVPEWFRRVGGPGADRVTAAAALANGDVVLVGDTADACPAVGGRRDVWLVTLSNSGRARSESCFGGEDLDEAHGAVVVGDVLWVTGRTASVSRSWTGVDGLAPGYERAFVAKVALPTRALEASFLVSSHIGRGNALAAGAGGIVFAAGEISDVGRRFLAPANSEMRPTAGAFSLGAAEGSTDPYLIGFSASAR